MLVACCQGHERVWHAFRRRIMDHSCWPSREMRPKQVSPQSRRHIWVGCRSGKCEGGRHRRILNLNISILPHTCRLLSHLLVDLKDALLQWSADTGTVEISENRGYVNSGKTPSRIHIEALTASSLRQRAEHRRTPVGIQKWASYKWCFKLSSLLGILRRRSAFFNQCKYVCTE